MDGNSAGSIETYVYNVVILHVSRLVAGKYGQHGEDEAHGSEDQGDSSDEMHRGKGATRACSWEKNKRV